MIKDLNNRFTILKKVCAPKCGAQAAKYCRDIKQFNYYYICHTEKCRKVSKNDEVNRVGNIVGADSCLFENNNCELHLQGFQ